jgi:hypothetical protein
MVPVPSVEPSSTTTTVTTPAMVRTPRMVSAMRTDSSLAGMMTATGRADGVIAGRPFSAG